MPAEFTLPLKLLPGGRLPKRAHPSDAGLDCYARRDALLIQGVVTVIPLGFQLGALSGMYGDPPYEVQVRGRSGLASDGIVAHVGTVDSGYRGELSVMLVNLTDRPFQVKAGDRVAQIVIAPIIVPAIKVTDVVGTSDRGANGFGSTGTR